MARRRKACDFCEEDFYSEDYKEHRNGFIMWAEWYPMNNGLLSVIAQANDENGEAQEDSIDFNFEYCPMCGRKLSE